MCMLFGRPRTFQKAFISRFMSSAPLSGVEKAKQLAAFQAVDDFVRDGMIVGVGSGSTIVYAVDRLSAKAKEGLRMTCIPTSFQATEV